MFGFVKPFTVQLKCKRRSHEGYKNPEDLENLNEKLDETLKELGEAKKEALLKELGAEKASGQAIYKMISDSLVAGTGIGIVKHLVAPRSLG